MQGLWPSLSQHVSLTMHWGLRTFRIYPLLFLYFACTFVVAQGIWPAAAPLTVRSPYLNVWQASTSTNEKPIFWDGSVRRRRPTRCTAYKNSQIQQTVGWVGLIRVDGTTYQWFGNSSYTYESAGPFKCNVTSTQITPTRTVQFVQAGPLNMTLTFLSPIEVR